MYRPINQRRIGLDEKPSVMSSNVTNGYAETRDGQIHFRRAGSVEDAPVVMLHMVGSSSRSFEPLMCALLSDVPSIAVDLMNYGESYRTPQEASVEYIACIVLQSLASLDIKHFHVFGHHLGAAVAVAMAKLSPHGVLSVILNGIAYATPNETAAFAATMAIPNPASSKGVQLTWAWSRIRDNFDLAGVGAGANAAEIMHRDVVDMLRAGEHWHWGYVAAFRYDPTAAMRELTCPIMFVSGKRDPVDSYHQRAVDAYPDAATYTVPAGGIYLVETHAAELATVVRQFVQTAGRVRSASSMPDIAGTTNSSAEVALSSDGRTEQ